MQMAFEIQTKTLIQAGNVMMQKIYCQKRTAATSSARLLCRIARLWTRRAVGTEFIRSKTRIRFGSLVLKRPNLQAPNTIPIPMQGKIKRRTAAIDAAVAHEIFAIPGPLARFAPSTKSSVGMQQSESMLTADATNDPKITSLRKDT